MSVAGLPEMENQGTFIYFASGVRTLAVGLIIFNVVEAAAIIF